MLTEEKDANKSVGRKRVSDLPVRPVDRASPAVEEIARYVAEVAGGLSLSIARRAVKLEEVRRWVRLLRLAAELLENRFLGGSREG